MEACKWWINKPIAIFSSSWMSEYLTPILLTGPRVKKAKQATTTKQQTGHV